MRLKILKQDDNAFKSIIAINEYNDTVEVNIFVQENGKYKAYALLVDNKPPWREFTVKGHGNSEEESMRNALKRLYQKVYSN